MARFNRNFVIGILTASMFAPLPFIIGCGATHQSPSLIGKLQPGGTPQQVAITVTVLPTAVATTTVVAPTPLTQQAPAHTPVREATTVVPMATPALPTASPNPIATSAPTVVATKAPAVATATAATSNSTSTSQTNVLAIPSSNGCPAFTFHDGDLVYDFIIHSGQGTPTYQVARDPENPQFGLQLHHARQAPFVTGQTHRQVPQQCLDAMPDQFLGRDMAQIMIDQGRTYRTAQDAGCPSLPVGASVQDISLYNYIVSQSGVLQMDGISTDISQSPSTILLPDSCWGYLDANCLIDLATFYQQSRDDNCPNGPGSMPITPTNRTTSVGGASISSVINSSPSQLAASPTKTATPAGLTFTNADKSLQYKVIGGPLIGAGTGEMVYRSKTGTGRDANGAVAVWELQVKKLGGSDVSVIHLANIACSFAEGDSSVQQSPMPDQGLSQLITMDWTSNQPDIVLSKPGDTTNVFLACYMPAGNGQPHMIHLLDQYNKIDMLILPGELPGVNAGDHLEIAIEQLVNSQKGG